MIRIRRFRCADRAFVLRLAAADLAEARVAEPRDPAPESGDAVLWFEAGLRSSWSRRTHFLVAEVDGTPAGFAIAGPANDDWDFRDGPDTERRPTRPRAGEIYELSVAGPFRRRGIGSALLRAAERGLFRRGYREVVLGHAARNAPAAGLYAARGYRPIRIEEWKRLEPVRRPSRRIGAG